LENLRVRIFKIAIGITALVDVLLKRDMTKKVIEKEER
jgi:hypothetical protein